MTNTIVDGFERLPFQFVHPSVLIAPDFGEFVYILFEYPDFICWQVPFADLFIPFCCIKRKLFDTLCIALVYDDEIVLRKSGHFPVDKTVEGNANSKTYSTFKQGIKNRFLFFLPSHIAYVLILICIIFLILLCFVLPVKMGADKRVYVAFLVIRFVVNRMERKLPTASVALQCSFADFEQLTNVLVVVQPFAFQHIVPLIKIFQCLVCMVKPIHNAFHPRLEIFFVCIHNYAINPMTKSFGFDG